MMTYLDRNIFLLLLSGFMSVCSLANAQSGHFSSNSLSMGGTGTAFIDTYHANFVNPANLMLNQSSKPSRTIGLLGGVSATAGGPLVNISVYNEYFTTGATVNTQQALNEWFGSNAAQNNRVGLELDLIPIGLAWRGKNMGVSIAIRNRSLFKGSMNRGYAEILLSGISEERFSEPKPVNFGTKGFIFSEISAGFSYKLLGLKALPGIGQNVKIYAGVAPKYIIPHYTSSLDFNSTLQVTGDKIVHDFQYTFQTVGSLAKQFQEYYEARQQDNFEGSLGDFVQPEADSFTEVQGAGFGVDLGGTIEMELAGPLAGVFSWIKGKKFLRVGLSVTDIGTVSYTNYAGSFSADETFTWEGIEFDESFEEALSDSISKEIYLNYQPGNKRKIQEQLPTKVNIGGHLKLGKLALALDIKKGFNESGMNSRRMVLGVGAEYKFFNFLPLRAGYRTGGLSSSSITFGTGIEFRNFEFTVAGMTVPNSRNHGSAIGGAWSGLVFSF